MAPGQFMAKHVLRPRELPMIPPNIDMASSTIEQRVTRRAPGECPHFSHNSVEAVARTALDRIPVNTVRIPGSGRRANLLYYFSHDDICHLGRNRWKNYMELKKHFLPHDPYSAHHTRVLLCVCVVRLRLFLLGRALVLFGGGAGGNGRGFSQPQPRSLLSGSDVTNSVKRCGFVLATSSSTS